MHLCWLFTVCSGVLRWNLNRTGCSLAFSATVCKHKDGKPVQWNSAEEICEPDVCKNVDLSTLPDVSGHAPPCIIHNMELYDSQKARQCLADKRVLLLGESTMGELGLDLQLLLSGAGADSPAIVRFLQSLLGTGAKVHDAMFPDVADTKDNAIATHFHWCVKEFNDLSVS